jgi:hypothetical protein
MTPQADGKAPSCPGSREAAEPGDVADASGDADGHGLELILGHMSWLREVTGELQLTEEPGA